MTDPWSSGSLPPCVLVLRTANVDHGFTNVSEHANSLLRRQQSRTFIDLVGQSDYRFDVFPLPLPEGTSKHGRLRPIADLQFREEQTFRQLAESPS